MIKRKITAKASNDFSDKNIEKIVFCNICEAMYNINLRDVYIPK